MTASESTEPAIAFDQVGLTTPDGRVILDHVELEIPTGSTTALLGRSGSGKTTLLRMVNRLVEPTAGRVLVEAKATTDWDPIALRRSIGYVIQETGLFPHFDAERNIGTVLEIEGRPRQERSPTRPPTLYPGGIGLRHLCPPLALPAFRWATPACRPGAGARR